jgi:hypothetical protein
MTGSAGACEPLGPALSLIIFSIVGAFFSVGSIVLGRGCAKSHLQNIGPQ